MTYKQLRGTLAILCEMHVTMPLMQHSKYHRVLNHIDLTIYCAEDNDNTIAETHDHLNWKRK